MVQSVVSELPKRWLTNAEAMKYLGVGEDFMQNLRDNALIHFYKKGRTIWYEVADIDAFVLKRKIV